MGFIIVYTTHKDNETAKELSDILLQEKSIACYNVFPIESSYWWGGNIERNGEYVSLLKTTHEKWDTLQSRILEIHPYTVPCIMKIEVEANTSYEDWIRNEMK